MTDYLNPLVVSIDTISQPSSIYFTMEINPNMYVRKERQFKNTIVETEQLISTLMVQSNLTNYLLKMN